MPIKLTTEILTAALAGYEEQKKRIGAQIAGLRQMLDGGSTDGSAPETAQPRRKMLAAARKRIAAAQRKRWAESRTMRKGASRKQKTPELFQPERRILITRILPLGGEPCTS